MAVNFRRAGAVLGPELLVAPPVALGAVYCASTFTPGMLKKIEGVVSKHIVEPHLEWFESLSGSLRKAHVEYDRKRREEMEARAETVPKTSAAPASSGKEQANAVAGTSPASSQKEQTNAAAETPVIPVASRKERADVIAGVLTKGAIAMVGDVSATLVGQKLAGRLFGVHIPKRTAFFESAIHLGGIAIAAGVPSVAARTEDAHYWIKHRLEKWGMSEQKADDLGTAIPYIVIPGQVAALASLTYSHAHAAIAARR
jgi:hypothetical protein